jgi:O-methyltransferase
MSSEPSAGREIRAVGPRPDAEGLRTAYLELLKLCLCDLAGVGTEAVYRTFEEEPRMYSRELPPEQMDYRVSGRDWPLRALTMTGLQRLDDLQACVESVVADGVEGDLIEVGTWRGGASILMRATLDALGADQRTVWLADSFEGFPPPDRQTFPEDGGADDLSGFNYLAAPLEEVRGHFARFGCDRGIEFAPGLFKETLPSLRGRRWSVIRLDGDTYESTWLALECLYPGLATGGYLIVDDYHFVAECQRAVDDFRSQSGIDEPLRRVDWSCARWRRESEAAAQVEPPRSRLPAAGEEPAARPPERVAAPLPTAREIELQLELDELRERLRAAAAELERAQGRAEA